jgi:hypothetical protein
MATHGTLLPYQRNIADNMRAEHGIPQEISDSDILNIWDELSPMDGEELTYFLREEFTRTGDWHTILSGINPQSFYS